MKQQFQSQRYVLHNEEYVASGVMHWQQFWDINYAESAEIV